MKMKGYTLLGWLTWQGIKTVAKRKLGQNKAKLGGAATALGLLVGGVVATKVASGNDSE